VPKTKAAKPLRLTAEDREFLHLVGKIGFMNPFDRERVDLIRRLVPAPARDRFSSEWRAFAGVVEARMRRLDPNARLRIDDFSSADRPHIETAFLFLAYYRFVDDLDALIERQSTTAAPLVAPFAHDLVDYLQARGMGESDAIRYLGFFYQLRRAFYFIVHGLTGDCPSMQAFRRALWNSTFTHDLHNYSARMWNRMEDFSTLILGETGTGKGNAAAAIGRSSFIPFAPATGRFAASFTETFVALNLSQFPETLIESELFGHRKGAFTGAIDNHQGVLERTSEHGALFLDEIGEVSVPVQIKLLQVLQERSFVPLGSHAPQRFAGRVIAATNRTLAELREGRMRDDFYYRLCSDVIEVPPLRQRIAESPRELEQLVALLVARMTGEESSALTARALDGLRQSLPADYAWPGNVRELEQAVRRILLTGRNVATGNDAAARSAPGAAEGDLVDALRRGALSADNLVAGYCRLLYARSGNFSEVAARTGLDRRTVKKHVQRMTGSAAVP
jgi:DNA-binding NtrC family response regulator